MKMRQKIWKILKAIIKINTRGALQTEFEPDKNWWNQIGNDQGNLCPVSARSRSESYWEEDEDLRKTPEKNEMDTDLDFK